MTELDPNRALGVLRQAALILQVSIADDSATAIHWAAFAAACDQAAQAARDHIEWLTRPDEVDEDLLRRSRAVAGWTEVPDDAGDSGSR